MTNRRLPAEWEPQSAVQLTWPHEESDWAGDMDIVVPCFVAIAREILKRQKLVVVCKDSEAVRKQIGSESANLMLVELPTNDTWARDHGAISIEEDGKPVLLDFVFNGWGLKFAADKDNLISGRLHERGIFGKVPMRHAGLAFEGGSFESDGEGTLLTTTECLLSRNRNPHLSKQEVEDKLKELFGVKKVLWLNNGYLAGDDTDSHIDTLARLVPGNKILYVKCDDTADEHYQALNKMEAELQNLTNSNGMPYELMPLPMADVAFDDEGNRLPATYANYLIINGAVLVPFYQSPKDQKAAAIIQRAFPQHEIVGIDCRPLILQHGSLHCVTMQYPVGVVE
ncbi:agmatine deiminase family protein [Imperialibacter roseus]|uniref:Agmatine deiminase family protein n=1 Tax=Imperialibacter roseus TaxID=1324217 RepID=A0ABZ0IX85_9BACT|nr:agmatine deiminase family protein [Imperialibacter roseus]WOK09662.1 agmatine deiminase family protein [Imperialibacter roseus]